jgi:hypothetical protein
MGLFDRVIYPGRCEGCGRKLTEFQTTDTSNPAILAVRLSRVNIFYTICYCGTSAHYKRTDDGFKQLSVKPEKLRVAHGHAIPAYPEDKGPKV